MARSYLHRRAGARYRFDLQRLRRCRVPVFLGRSRALCTVGIEQPSLLDSSKALVGAVEAVNLRIHRSHSTPAAIKTNRRGKTVTEGLFADLESDTGQA